MKCVIHYPHIAFSEKLTPVDESRWRELVSAKECRVRLGGKYVHEQIHSIPNTYTENLHYHRECYANFTRARSDEKPRGVLQELPSSSTNRAQRSCDIDASGRFPKHCWFCKSINAKRVRTKTKDKLEAVGLISPDASGTLLAAAKKKNDETLLRCIEGENIHLKGFRKHSSCYVDYTSVLYERNTILKVDRNEEVRKLIQKQVVEEGKCLSLDDILEIKGEKKNKETSAKELAQQKL